MSLHSQAALLFGFTQIKERLYLVKLLLPLFVSLYFSYSSVTLLFVHRVEYSSLIDIKKIFLIVMLYFTPYAIISLLLFLYESFYVNSTLENYHLKLREFFTLFFQGLSIFVILLIAVLLFLHWPFSGKASHELSTAVPNSNRWSVFGTRLFLLLLSYLILSNLFKRVFTIKRCVSYELFKILPESDGVDSDRVKIFLGRNFLYIKGERVARFLLPFKRHFIIDKAITRNIELSELKALVYIELSNYMKNLYIARYVSHIVSTIFALALSIHIFNNVYNEFGFIKPFDPASFPLFFFWLYLLLIIFFFFTDYFFIELEKDYLRKEVEKGTMHINVYRKLLKKLLDYFPQLDRNTKSILPFFRMNFGLSERHAYINKIRNDL
ncbi:MAG: hypothetical protein PF637_05385 [Spirochaetes bacterium]|nr:hypothetical protein [Spirochaetota bacterium]